MATQRVFWERRNVLVTGGAGFIGYALASELARRGAHVFVLDIKKSLPPFAFLDQKTKQKIRYIRGSVTSKSTVRRALKDNRIQTIFHLAAEAIVLRANKNPLLALETNILGTWVPLECARAEKTIGEIVVASSDKAYGTHARLPYTEDAPLQGKNPYDASKSCADIVAQMYASAFKVPVAIVRSGNVYGPGDMNFTRLIPDAFRSVARGAILPIRSDGTFKRDYLYIDDVVDAYILVAENVVKKRLRGEAFNLGNNKPLSVLQVMREIQKVAPRLKYKVLNVAKNEIRHQYLDATKIFKKLSWRAKVPLSVGFKKTGAWYSQYFKLPTWTPLEVQLPQGERSARRK